MLDVTQKNFNKVYNLFDNLLFDKDAAFVSVDLEFSGLGQDPYRRGWKHELPSERYEK